MAGGGAAVDDADVVDVDAGGWDVSVGAEVVEAEAAGSDVSAGTEEAVMEVLEVEAVGPVAGVVEAEAVVGAVEVEAAEAVVEVGAAVGVVEVVSVPGVAVTASGAEAGTAAAVGSGSLSPLSLDEHAAATSAETTIAAPVAKIFVFIAQKPPMRIYPQDFTTAGSPTITKDPHDNQKLDTQAASRKFRLPSKLSLTPAAAENTKSGFGELVFSAADLQQFPRANR